MEKPDYIRQELNRHFQEWAIKAAFIGAGIFLALSPLDFASSPEHARRFLGYRIATAAGLVIIAGLAGRMRRPAAVRLAVFVAIILSAVALEAMILDFGGHASPYGIGMILLAVVVLGFIPAGVGFASLLAGCIFAVYLIPILIRGQITESRFFAVSSFLFLCILFIGVAVRWLNLRHHVREISLRHDLIRHQEELEAEVAQHAKTESMLRMETEQRRDGDDRLRLYAAAVEGAAEGIYIVDPEGSILYCNQASADQLGFPLEEMRARSVRDLIGWPETLERIILPAISRVGYWAGEVPGFMKDGHLRSLWLTASLVRDDAGRPIAVVGITKDLSAQKKVEDDHIKTQKLESIGVLAGGLAHDFNNLLTIILGNLDLARLFAGENPDIIEALDHAAEASLRAGDLTRQLITFSKGGQPVKQIADIGQLIKDTVVFAASGSNVAYDFTISDGLPPVEFDEGQMRQVVHNLVQNAKEAMSGGGTLRVRVREIHLAAGEISSLPAGRYVQTDFTDHGTGIAQEHLHQIFDPYFSTKEMSAVKGRGLGLAVSYSIIRNHGGAITVDSRFGAGTTFSVFLPASGDETSETDEEPAAVAPVAPPITPAPSRRPPAASPPGPMRGRVLVVDDETLMLEMAGTALCQMGYDAELCRDGAEAIVRYQIGLDSGKPFAAVILDLTVPGGMGGRETLGRLREIDPSVQAAISSGYTNDPIATTYGSEGFAAFVAKPYTLKTLEELLARIV